MIQLHPRTPSIRHLASVALAVFFAASHTSSVRGDVVAAEYDPASGTFGANTAAGGLFIAAQTFTPTVSGTVLDVGVLLRGNGPASPTSLPVSIRNTSGGLPTGAPLATVNISPILSGTQAYYFADFSAEMIDLVAGEVYAIVLGIPATGGYGWRGDSSGSYAGGNAISSSNNGASWNALSGADWGFSVTVSDVVTAGYDPTIGAFSATIGAGGSIFAGQTFTPSVSGSVLEVGVFVRANSPSSPTFIPVSITASSGGLPTGAPLATVNISPILGATPTFVYADFSTEMIDLVAGEAYAIVVGSPATGGLVWRGDFPGSYAGGNAVISFDSGASWSGSGDADRGFSVIVDADCNGDGIVDDFQVDSDGDGIIDECDDDNDNDGVLDEFDVCPSSRPGLPVDGDGRPLRDCNNDCLVNGLDLQCIVGELLGS